MLRRIQNEETEGFLNIVNLSEFYYILYRRDAAIAEEKVRNLRAYGIEIVPLIDNAIWREALGKKMALPKRGINSLEELVELFPGIKDIFIDRTESPIQRSSDNEKQKESYSGEKKAHTRKNIVITDFCGSVKGNW